MFKRLKKLFKKDKNCVSRLDVKTLISDVMVVIVFIVTFIFIAQAVITICMR